MHYYKFNIGNYYRHTNNLSLLEDLAYRRMLDKYYLNEQPFPNDIAKIARLIGMRESLDEVSIILEDYFYLKDGEWYNESADESIKAYQSNSEINKENGKKGGRPRKITQSVTDGNPSESEPKGNQEPLTNNHKPITNIKDIRGNSKSLPPVPYAKILELYHSTLPELSKVEKLTDKRKSYIRQRWISKDIEDLDTWKEFFQYVKKSKFLTGQVQAQNGRKTFRADLEWLTKESNFVKIWEGNYHGEI